MNRNARINRSGALDIAAVFVFLGAIFTAGAAPSAADSFGVRKAGRIQDVPERLEARSLRLTPQGRCVGLAVPRSVSGRDLSAGTERLLPATAGIPVGYWIGERGELVRRKAGWAVAVHAEEVSSVRQAPERIPIPRPAEGKRAGRYGGGNIGAGALRANVSLAGGGGFLKG